MVVWMAIPQFLYKLQTKYSFGVHVSLLDFISSFKIVRILASTCLGLKCDNAYKVSVYGTFCHNSSYCNYVCTESLPVLLPWPLPSAFSHAPGPSCPESPEQGLCAVTSGHEQHVPWPRAGDAAVSLRPASLLPEMIHWLPCTDESRYSSSECSQITRFKFVHTQGHSSMVPEVFLPHHIPAIR